MTETKFTKGELIIEEDEQTRYFSLLQDDGDGCFYIVCESITTKHDANLFKVANEMYKLLEDYHMKCNFVYGENYDEVEELLAKARGEA